MRKWVSICLYIYIFVFVQIFQKYISFKYLVNSCLGFEVCMHRLYSVPNHVWTRNSELRIASLYHVFATLWSMFICNTQFLDSQKKVAVFAMTIFDLLASRRDFHPQHPEWQLQMCGPTKLKQKLMGCSNQKNKTQLLVILLIIHVDGRCPQICWASRPFVRCANGTLCHLHAVAPESLPPHPPMETCRCSVELISSSWLNWYLYSSHTLRIAMDCINMARS